MKSEKVEAKIEEAKEAIKYIVRKEDPYLNIDLFIEKMKKEYSSGMSLQQVSQINGIPEKILKVLL